MSKMIIGLLGISKNVNKRFALRIAVGISALFFVLVGGACAVTPINDCTTISSPGTYALTRNIGNSANSIFCISITSSDVVFDGAGYIVDGIDTSAANYGIYVYNPSTVLTNVTLKNLIVKNWKQGINYTNVQNGIIDNNNFSGYGYDIYLSSSRNNILSGNTVSNIYLQYSSNNALNSNNVSTGRINRISLDSSSSNTLSNNYISSGGITLTGSNNNILNDNKVSDGAITLGGYSLDESSNGNTLSGNSVSKHSAGREGIWIGFSSNNIVNDNIVSFNFNGIKLFHSNDNTVSGNNISNSGYALLLTSSNNNTVSSNLDKGNNNGISINLGSSGNTIYNNFFNSVSNIDFIGSGANTWNIAKTAGTNIVGGPYIGGNVWAYPSGTGYSQTCNDVNADGICDSSRTLDASNIDNLPLVYTTPAVTPTFTTVEITPTTTATQRTAVSPTITTVKITPTTTVTVSPKVPGFEIVSMIVVGIAIFLIRRKK
ncbi:MAG: hypothetical protein E4G94_09560 [ANME-2 cluster archaeon]|nr:MAG: hypothetical protein E4G94_09560 [ANME-2 cluster archaeon]